MASTNSGSSIPVTQMISAKHDNVTIWQWLEELVQTTGIPKELVIDESAALLLASVKALTQFSNVFEYMNQCHLILEGADLPLPTCFIRHDISHIVKNIKNAKVFEKQPVKVKTLYLYTIGLLFKIEDFTEMKRIIEDLLIMAYCEFETHETETSRKRLNLSIETHNIKNIYSDSESNDDENSIDESHEILNTANKKQMNWFEEIKNTVLNLNLKKEKNRKDEKDNFYYFPKFLPYLEGLIYKVPTWGAVMKTFFNSANLNVSSSNCESEFKYVKRYLFKNVKKIRIDKFLLKHIQDIIGRMVLAISDFENHQHKIKEGTY